MSPSDTFKKMIKKFKAETEDSEIANNFNINFMIIVKNTKECPEEHSESQVMDLIFGIQVLNKVSIK